MAAIYWQAAAAVAQGRARSTPIRASARARQTGACHDRADHPGRGRRAIGGRSSVLGRSTASRAGVSLTSAGRLDRGRIHLRRRRGALTASAGRSERCPLAATITVHDPGASTGTAVFGGTIGAAEAYMAGLLDDRRPHCRWSASSLLQPPSVFGRHGHGAGPPRGAALPRLFHAAARATRAAGSRRNIAAHYDLGNDFYRALPRRDADLLVRHLRAPEDVRLREASIAKFDRICRKLELSARATTCSRSARAGAGLRSTRRGRYGCRVTTTTISDAAARAGRRARSRRPASRTGSRCSRRTTAT